MQTGKYDLYTSKGNQTTGNTFEGSHTQRNNGRNFPNMVKTLVCNIQDQGGKIDSKKSTPRQIIVKMSKVKDSKKILKAAREKK
jgi:hypothetical protein